MTGVPFGFDDFCRKWVPQPPEWAKPQEVPLWLSAPTEEKRLLAYLAQMGQTGGDLFSFSRDVQDSLKRDVGAGLSMFEILDRLGAHPETSDRTAVVVLFQRVFGVPLSRARYIASWNPENRGREAQQTLARILVCVADAQRAGLWSALDEEA